MKYGCLISFRLLAAILASIVLVSRCADETRQTAEWTLCNAISVGGWRRLCTQPSGAPQ